VSPFTLILCVALLRASLFFATRYMKAAREMKRLESIAKSPIMENFRSMISGLETIRAYNQTSLYMDEMHKLIDSHLAAWWYSALFKRWLGFRMAMIGSLLTTAVGVLVVARGVDASLAGFAMSFSLQFAAAISSAVNRSSNTELNMNSAERIVEYANLAVERDDGVKAPDSWPSQGSIEIKDLVVRYAPDLPPVLKGFNFSAAPGERIGIIGRTGAGKSSFTLALFRLLEAEEGSITIDGYNISKFSLRDVRGKLAIIPQDPTLLSGTIRENLDPFNHFSDETLKMALQKVCLAEPTFCLSTSVGQGGLNFSHGQRQLLCLARLLILKPKIIVLDEATSAIDRPTDLLIQQSIREQFVGITLIVIAHRLSTVADFDKIVVMSDGRNTECGSPHELMEVKGLFFDLVQESGDVNNIRSLIE